MEKASKELKKGMVVYQLIGNRIYKKWIVAIVEREVDGEVEKVLWLNKGNDISIKKLGTEIFLRKSDAKKYKK